MGRAALVYVAAALVYTWPLALHPTSHLAAPVGPGDPFLNLWILGWGMQTILGHPMDVLNGRVFNANIFFPAESTLAYSDHLLLQSALMAPVYAVTGNVVLAYNVLLFLSLVLSAVAMHAYVRAVTGSVGGAYLAGLVWGFWSYRFAHLVHLQLQALYFLPLAFLLVHRVVAGRRRRDALALGLVAGLQALSSIYYAVIGGIALVVGAIALSVGVGRWRSGVIARRLFLAALVGAALVAPVGWVYWRLQREEGFGRSLYEASRNAATLASYAQVPAENVLYGRTGLLRAAVLEQAVFPGVAVLVLAGVGVVRGRRGDARPLVLAMISIGVVGFALSFGPDGIRDLYAFFQRAVFGSQAIRAPARFAVLVMFALTTLAALGWREFRGASYRRWTIALFALAAIELLNVPMPLTAAPPLETGVGQWLRREPGDGAVAFLPIGVDVESTPAMVQSLEHRRPLINGYSGQRPSFYTALVDSLGTFPGDEALLALKEVGARFVVSRAVATAADAAKPSPLVERARFGDDVIYELRWTPEIEARLAADVAVTPPEPGIAPFGAGETTRYSALWAGAGMNVSAGEITLSVESPPYTFVARGDTAPWMTRFFEAHDTFSTKTDARLLPEISARDQREGSRHLERTFLYDHRSGVVRIGRSREAASSEEGISLPLAAGARDVVSAVFYVRTLPMSPGDRYLFPVNEGGRNLVVELTVVGRETIAVQGQQVSAIRAEPKMRRRAERRRPIQASIWFSDDERKVPLALDLDAPFGRVRLELVGYKRGQTP